MEIRYKDACVGAPQFAENMMSDERRTRINAFMRVMFACGVVTRLVSVAIELGTLDAQYSSKEDQSPYSIAEERTLAMLRAGLKQEKLEVLLDDEEGQSGNEDSKTVAVTDNVDGTQNFLMGLKGFFTNVIGVYENGEHDVSIVNDPMNVEMFVAVKGEGSWKFVRDHKTGDWKAPKRLQVSSRAIGDGEGGRPFISADTKVYKEDPILVDVLGKLGYQVEPLPGSSKKITLVASRPNFVGIFRSQQGPGNPDEHDIAAAELIVSEAGCVATSMHGGPVLTKERKFHDGFIYANPGAHRDIKTAAFLQEQLTGRTVQEGRLLTTQEQAKHADKIVSAMTLLYYLDDEKLAQRLVAELAKAL